MAIKNSETGKVSYVGRVLSATEAYEKFNEMTVLNARVLTEGDCRILDVCIAAKFAEGSWHTNPYEMVDVDATDAVIDEATRVLAAEHLTRIAADAIDEARKLERGVEVEVIAGRKIAKGTVGRIFWAGETKYGYRVGLTLADGSQEWTAEHNVTATEEHILGTMPAWSEMVAKAQEWAAQIFASARAVPASERAARARRFDDAFKVQMVEAIERSEPYVVQFDPNCPRCGGTIEHPETTAFCEACEEVERLATTDHGISFEGNSSCNHCGSSWDLVAVTSGYVCRDPAACVERREKQAKPTNAIEAALQAMVLDPQIRTFLEMYDPQALKQAIAALEDVGLQHTPVEVE